MTIREKINDGSTFEFESTGQMIIDKSSGTKEITATGRLEPMDMDRSLFHYSFDQEDLSQPVYNSGQFGSRLYKGLPM